MAVLGAYVVTVVAVAAGLSVIFAGGLVTLLTVSWALLALVLLAVVLPVPRPDGQEPTGGGRPVLIRSRSRPGPSRKDRGLRVDREP